MQPLAIMDNLPEEVILEILICLPVKSLLCFKCVSISWFSLISDPYFAKLHFQRSSSRHAHRILYYTVGSQMQSIDINASLHDDSAIAKLDFPLLIKPGDIFHILGSCRGFILLYRDLKELFLWNPATRVFKQIPPPLPNLAEVLLYGFCYYESTNDYPLVLATFPNDPSGLDLGFYVFSLRSNSWEKFALNYNLDGYNGLCSLTTPDRIGLMLNGAIHWLIQQLIGHPEDTLVEAAPEAKIIGFDISTKYLRDVPMPNDVTLHFCRLGVLGGCLSLTEKKNDEIKIWVMREYGVKSSWTKLTSLSCLGGNMDYLLPLCFTEDGQLVAEIGFKGISKWSNKGELLEFRQYSQESFWGYGTVYNETLLSLP